MKNRNQTPESAAPAPEQPAAPAPSRKADQPSPALAGHFAVVGTVPGRVMTTTHGLVDLREISLEQAQELHATGNFQYLEPVGSAA